MDLNFSKQIEARTEGFKLVKQFLSESSGEVMEPFKFGGGPYELLDGELPEKYMVRHHYPGHEALNQELAQPLFDAIEAEGYHPTVKAQNGSFSFSDPNFFNITVSAKSPYLMNGGYLLEPTDEQFDGTVEIGKQKRFKWFGEEVPVEERVKLPVFDAFAQIGRLEGTIDFLNPFNKDVEPLTAIIQRQGFKVGTLQYTPEDQKTVMESYRALMK